jgi:hypothetical protein
MKKRIIEVALKSIIVIELSTLVLGLTLSILEFVGREDLVNKIVNILI